MDGPEVIQCPPYSSSSEDHDTRGRKKHCFEQAVLESSVLWLSSAELYGMPKGLLQRLQRGNIIAQDNYGISYQQVNLKNVLYYINDVQA